MTIPKPISSMPRRLTDMVREMMPRQRIVFTEEEIALARHLKGNTGLFNSLKAVIESRLWGRVHSPVPTDPMECKGVLERDDELRRLMGRLEMVYRSMEAQPAEEYSEHPE